MLGSARVSALPGSSPPSLIVPRGPRPGSRCTEPPRPGEGKSAPEKLRRLDAASRSGVRFHEWWTPGGMAVRYRTGKLRGRSAGRGRGGVDWTDLPSCLLGHGGELPPAGGVSRKGRGGYLLPFLASCKRRRLRPVWCGDRRTGGRLGGGGVAL